MSYCYRITDRGMEYISYLGELSDLEMRGLVNITSMGIKKVAVNCRRLADLDLKHCEKIDDSGFWAIAFYSQNLRQVSKLLLVLINLSIILTNTNFWLPKQKQNENVVK